MQSAIQHFFIVLPPGRLAGCSRAIEVIQRQGHACAPGGGPSPGGFNVAGSSPLDVVLGRSGAELMP